MSRAKIVLFGLLVALSLSRAKEQTTAWQKAKLHARQANDAFERTHRFLYGWLRYQSITTSFVPQNILEQRYTWTIRNSAADLYPRLVLAGYFTDRPVLDQRLLLILNQEQKVCNRLGVLPDDVYLDDGSFVYADIDTGRIIFGASEYCKDGLVMITEVMGRTPWFDRMKQLADAILDLASVQTPYGVIPADNTEVNGEMLMTLTRLYTMTGEEKYIKWAERIADVYLFHIMPKNNDLPAFAWDFAADTSLTPEFKVSDHGNEILGGLALLYAVEKSLNSPKAGAYHDPLKKALDKLLDIATNDDGLFYTKVNPKTGQPTSEILT
ncbi:MAG TPA: hypothetical protein EYP14_17720, partial [Planctomycetaceae bacterium]|nr:hypothetical protein [Planctomycetaceae bacterium]